MIWQVLYNGVVAGALLALVALGYTLIYGVSRLINFAHGDTMMVSAYACFFLLERTHCPLYVALGFALIVGIGVAVLIERLAVRPASRSGDTLAPVISTLGAGVVLQAGIGMLFGTASRSFPIGENIGGFQLGLVHTTNSQIGILATGLVLSLLLMLFLRRNRYGQSLRAVADDPYLSETVGIDPKRTIVATFAISGLLAAAAGVALGFDAALRPFMGYAIGLRGFTAAIVGGIGNPLGAVVGGMLIGIATSFAGSYLPSEWTSAFVFVLLILMLFVRPQGLLPSRKT